MAPKRERRQRGGNPNRESQRRREERGLISARSFASSFEGRDSEGFLPHQRPVDRSARPAEPVGPPPAVPIAAPPNPASGSGSWVLQWQWVPDTGAAAPSTPPKASPRVVSSFSVRSPRSLRGEPKGSTSSVPVPKTPPKKKAADPVSVPEVPARPSASEGVVSSASGSAPSTSLKDPHRRSRSPLRRKGDPVSSERKQAVQDLLKRHKEKKRALNEASEGVLEDQAAAEAEGEKEPVERPAKVLSKKPKAKSPRTKSEEVGSTGVTKKLTLPRRRVPALEEPPKKELWPEGSLEAAVPKTHQRLFETRFGEGVTVSRAQQLLDEIRAKQEPKAKSSDPRTTRSSSPLPTRSSSSRALAPVEPKSVALVAEEDRPLILLDFHHTIEFRDEINQVNITAIANLQGRGFDIGILSFASKLDTQEKVISQLGACIFVDDQEELLADAREYQKHRARGNQTVCIQAGRLATVALDPLLKFLKDKKPANFAKPSTLRNL